MVLDCRSLDYRSDLSSLHALRQVYCEIALCPVGLVLFMVALAGGASQELMVLIAGSCLGEEGSGCGFGFWRVSRKLVVSGGFYQALTKGRNTGLKSLMEGIEIDKRQRVGRWMFARGVCGKLVVAPYFLSRLPRCGLIPLFAGRSCCGLIFLRTYPAAPLSRFSLDTYPAVHLIFFLRT